jgi:hypothetical protein
MGDTGIFCEEWQGWWQDAWKHEPFTRDIIMIGNHGAKDDYAHDKLCYRVGQVM